MPDCAEERKIGISSFLFSGLQLPISSMVSQTLSLSGAMPGKSSCFSYTSLSANSRTSPSSSFPSRILTSLNFIAYRYVSYSCIEGSFEKGSRDILTAATRCPQPPGPRSLLLDMTLCQDMFSWGIISSGLGRQQCHLEGWGGEGDRVQVPSPRAPCSAQKRWSPPGMLTFHRLQKPPEPKLVPPSPTSAPQSSAELQLPRSPLHGVLKPSWGSLCRFLSSL